VPKKVYALILSACLIITPLLTSNANAEDTTSAASDSTRLTGQVTAVDGRSITLALYSTPDGAGQSGTPSGSGKSTESVVSPTVSPLVTPTAPSSSDGTSGNGRGSGPGGGNDGMSGGMTLSGETETITISDSTSIKISSRDMGPESMLAGTISDIVVGSTLMVTLSGSLVTEVVIMSKESGGTASITAVSRSSSVSVNGTAVSFQAYNISGNNYFKLRDLAMALANTNKCFSVGFDSAASSIILTSGAAYTSVGGELTLSDDTADVSVKPSTVSLDLDGTMLNLTAYNIGGNNFFKLRDLASALDFALAYDSATGIISINTSESYSA
jgi:hypothetical protein